MMVGTVNARNEAVVPLRLKGPGGIVADVEAIIDTGFTGTLTLPAATIAAPGLTLRSGGWARLADGSAKRFHLHAAQVLWDGQWQSILVSGVGHEVLLGMRLLAGHELRIKVVAGGPIEISKIAAPAP
jgi:predicted aspartyl protease